MKYSVYMLTSMKATWHYTGHASDVTKRLQTHTSGKVKSTKPWRPLKVFYTEEFDTKSEAVKREMFLKSSRGYLEKRRIIEEYDR